MQLFQILEGESIQGYCSDYGIATYLYVIKKALDIIHIAVPIILIVMVAVQLFKMVTSPDDKKAPKTLLNKFIAAVLVFFIPYIVNLIISVLAQSFDNYEISACWEAAETVAPSAME